MTTMSEAIQNGLRRGTRMAVAPSSARMWELSREAANTDFTAEAWANVGSHLRTAMKNSQSSKPSSK